MKNARTIFLLRCLILAALALPRADAALTLTLDAPVVNAAAGTTLVITGTLANTSPTAKVFLNDMQCTLPAGLAGRPNTFFANVPGILLPGEIYTGPLFSVALDLNAAGTDSAGTLALRGGEDAFAVDALTTAGFTVLSTVVTIAATRPDAFEFGAISGAFTVTRTGATGVPLMVPFTLGGSAGNGGDFATIAAPAVIPAGAASAEIAVTPIPNDIAEGDRACVITLAPSPSANLGAVTAVAVTIHDRPVDLWRFNQFGAAANTPAAGDTASWTGDGVANLIKYGTGLNPTMNSAAVVPRPQLIDGYLTLSFVPNPAATDVRYIVESATDFTSWSASEVDLITLSPARVYRYRHPVSDGGRAFLRMRIERLP